ncbi:MAG: hypothetical protein CMH57_10610 [Myxococcales bacterium]|nr:hypothetical protein [Myxococcales bacterium]
MGSLTLLSAAPRSETIVLIRDAIPLKEGVELEFAVDQRKDFVDTYTMTLHLDQIEHNPRGEVTGARLSWQVSEATKHRNYKANGELTTTALLTGRMLNCTWLGGQKASPRDTFAWLSRDACEEALHRGETRFAVDATLASGRPMRFQRVRHVQHPVTLHGRAAQLNAMELRSERGDTLVVLADCNNPLIVETEILGLASWRLDKVSAPSKAEGP